MHLHLENVRSGRRVFLASFDSLAWIGSLTGFALLSRDPSNTASWGAVLALGAVAAGVHLGLGRTVHLHSGRAALGTLEEMILLGLIVAGVGLVITPVSVAVDGVGPVVPVAATFMALVLMAWARAGYRRLGEPPSRSLATQGRSPVVVIGAGDGGRQLIASMLRDKGSRWLPAALLDDDPFKSHQRVRGVPVMGTTKRLVETAELVGASTAIVAIPSVSSERIRELTSQATTAGLELKVLPATNDLVRLGSVGVSDVRDVDVTDLLGRRQIETDIASVADYLTGRRVLVTGAGGSIGSELCRQVAQFGPSELIMLDRDESALHAVQLSIYGKAMLDSDDVVLGDIRDTQFLNTLFEQRRPDVAFHAAALKHLPMLEQYPGEAVKTNIWGTLSVLEAAKHSGVETFVNISTDKAANPVSVLGYSKRLAEGLTAAVASSTPGTYLSVRFGNVLGSRGSVLTAFTSQIEAGGPLTVTHPDVSRYFMTIPEAVQLVVQAAAIGQDGEALVLDMGEPVRIDGVARQLIELSGKSIDVVYTGLRDGEKLHEELLGDGEKDVRPVHPLVSHVQVPSLDPTTARALDPWAPSSQVVAVMRQLCSDLSAARRQVAS